MQPFRAAALVLLVLLAAAAAPPAAAQPQPNRILAVVNGDAISRSDVTNRRRLFALAMGVQGAPGALDRLNDQMLRLLIDERLRLQEVQRRRIAVPDADIASAIRDIETRNSLPQGGLRDQLRRAGIEPRVLFDQIRAQIGWTRLLRQLLGPNAAPSPEQVNEYIANQRARIGQPEYLVAEIFIPIDDPAAEPDTRRFVEEVISQLRGGLPFPIAAQQFSQSQTAVEGGDLGWVQPDALDPAVARIVQIMPPGAVSNAVRVPGGFQIVTLRQKRETGRDMATIVSLRQAFFPFTSTLDPNNPTQQQRDQLERAQRLGNARGCEAVEAAARAVNSPRPSNLGDMRLEQLEPPPLRELIGGLQPGRPSPPLVSEDGILVIAVCSRETRNLAELTPDQARATLLRDRVELLSRQLQRDLRRRAQIDIRTEARAEQRGG